MSEFAQKCENNAIFKQSNTLKLFITFKWPIFTVSVQGENQIFSKKVLRHQLLVKDACEMSVTVKPWSSLDKEKSLACQITSPFNNKLVVFIYKIKRPLKQPIFLLNLQASDSTLSKELDGQKDQKEFNRRSLFT